jgi:fibro-slime domain-containing protein
VDAVAADGWLDAGGPETSEAGWAGSFDSSRADQPFVTPTGDGSVVPPTPDAAPSPDGPTQQADVPPGPVDGGPAVDRMMPDLSGFTATNIGGYKLGTPVTVDIPGVPSGDGKTCDILTAVVRDFRGTCMQATDSWCVVEPNGHPDFESFKGDFPTTGLVASTLGSDHKPVYASMCEAGVKPGGPCPFGQMTTSKMYFDEWYRFTDGVNKPFLLYLQLVGANGVFTFASDHFFPLDNAGWGSSGRDVEGRLHNFGFTTELHTKFKYNGGETFTFSGDDDVWVFVNNRLALDLGGPHAMVTGTINLDAQAANLGIARGTIYPIELFHAERHTYGSNFRIDTNVAFVECGTIIR